MYNRQSHGGTSDAGRGLWLPLLVGAASLLLVLAGWSLFVSERRARLRQDAEDTASETRDAIVRALERRVRALQGIAELRTDLAQASDWEWHVRRRIDEVPGLTSVAWVSASASERAPAAHLVVGEARSLEEIRLALIRPEAQERDAPAIRVGPLREPDGVGFRVTLPPDSARPGAGALVAWLEVAPILDDALRGRARGHAVSLRWNDEEIYSRGTAVPAGWQPWWSVTYDIPLPLGGTWQAVHRPTPELAAALLTPAPHYFLVAGILLSLVLAGLTHQLRAVARQSRRLEASNRALEQRGQELETRVEERTAALSEAVTELEAFNSSVSHDLRSPLGAILNFTAILEEDYGRDRLDATGRTMLARIRRSALRANSLLDGLLQVSRTSRASLTLGEIDMSALARETFARVATAEDARGVELVIDALPTAVGDRALLGDVFANLFSNALKFSRGREKRRIAVTGEVGDELTTYHVADTGRGFDMRFVEKIFGLFERLHSEEEIEGTGVGLAMVARIVRRHGGRSWAESAPGRGARFSFSLPRREAP